MRIFSMTTLLSLIAAPAMAMPDMMLATPKMKLLFGFNLVMVALIVFCLAVILSSWVDRRRLQRQEIFAPVRKEPK